MFFPAAARLAAPVTAPVGKSDDRGADANCNAVHRPILERTIMQNLIDTDIPSEISSGMDIETELRKRAKASGMTMLAISKATGIAYSRIHRFLTGKGGPSLHSAERIAEAVGLTLKLVPAKSTGKAKG